MTTTTFHKVNPIEAVNWNSYADDVPNDAPGDDCPDHGPYGDDECPKCDYRLLDTLITRHDQGRCVPCGSAAHRSQQCPLVADILFAR